MAKSAPPTKASSAPMPAVKAAAPASAMPASAAPSSEPAKSAHVAALPSDAQTAPLYDEVAKLNAELQLAKGRAAKLSVDLELANKRRELEKAQGSGDNAIPKGMPAVVSIEGVGAKLVATLSFANGMVIGARAGDVLPTGAKVERIEPSAVYVKAGNRSSRLPLMLSKTQPFSYDTPVPGRVAARADSTSLPVLPPPMPAASGAPGALSQSPGMSGPPLNAGPVVTR